MFHGALDRFGSFRFDLFAGPCASVVFCGHLCEKAIAQAQRRIAETLKSASLHERRVYNGTGSYDLSAPGSDSINFGAFSNGHSAQLFHNFFHRSLGYRNGTLFCNGGQISRNIVQSCRCA